MFVTKTVTVFFVVWSLNADFAHGQGPPDFNKWTTLWQKTGCAQEYAGARLLLNARDVTSKHYTFTPKLLWTKYKTFLKAFVNQCAHEASSQGLVNFSIRYFGECWGWNSPTSNPTRSLNCVDGKFRFNCNKLSNNEECTGRGGADYVYTRVCLDMLTGMKHKIGDTFKPAQCEECTCLHTGFLRCTELPGCKMN